MITILTGTPGAGKTAYAVSKLIRPLIGTTADQVLDDGTTQSYPRTVYTNINGLLLDHEFIDGGATGGLRNWQDWAKPGSVIVYDEFQKSWPPRPNGAAVPADIQALDTHRHLGVDFILITQNVMNVDRHVHGLCNRHLHVRRIGNMATAIVYEWDHCSRQLLYSKALAKQVWRYDKSVYKLYKSAMLHTKQPRRIPGLIWAVIAAAVAAPVLAYNFYDNIQAKRQPAPALAASAKTTTMASLAASMPPRNTSASVTSPFATSSTFRATPKPALAGCVRNSNRCDCYDTAGAPAEGKAGLCEALAVPKPPPPTGVFDAVQEALYTPHDLQIQHDRAASDNDNLAFLRARRHASN